MSGWIKLHRKIDLWEWRTKPATFNLFINLLLMVNHKDAKWRGIHIPAGSVLTGRKRLAEITGLSEQQIRTALVNLKSTNEITIKSTKEYSIISIVNWKSYQDCNQPSTNVQPTINQPSTTNKNDNNDKNEKNILLGDASPPKPPKQKKGFRLPDDWECSVELGQWAMKEYGMTREQVANEIYSFIDYWRAKTGANSLKLDWDATFRNWIRNNIKWSKK